MSSQTGVKKLASSWAGECPQIKLSEDSTKKIESYIPVHDNIKREIQEKLEEQGFKCNEEYPVHYETPNGNKIIGKADLLCTRENVSVLIEIKSSFIGNGKPRDMMQLYLYYYLLTLQNININTMLLIYRNYNYTNEEKDVYIQLGEHIMISLPSKYVYVRLRNEKSIEQILRPEELVNELTAGGYVIGRDCEFCINESCPLIKSQRLSR